MNSAVTLAKYYHWIRYGKVNLVTCFFFGLVCYPLLHTVSGFKKRARPVVKSNRGGKMGISNRRFSWVEFPVKSQSAKNRKTGV